jgi:hypothetical protein
MHWKSLPLNKDDEQYLVVLLRGIEDFAQAGLLHRYALAWKAAHDAEPASHRKENAGRRAANTIIRQEAKAMRAEEPDMVKQYREWQNFGPPPCCHTCLYYSKEGVCEWHNMTPPAEFTQQIGQCPDWEMEIPF